MAGSPLACVVGDMDLVRPLGLAGVPVVAAGSIGREARWSKYTVSYLELPESWEDPEPIIDALVEFGRAQPQRPVLFYQKDHAALAVSRHRETLARCFEFVVPARDLVEDLVDKDRFEVLARECGLPIPAARTVVASHEIDAADLEHPYPVIAKPSLRARSRETWSRVAGNAKAVQCLDAGQLASLLRRPELNGVALVIQEYIPGGEDQIWSYHTFIDDDGVVRAEFTGRKIRTWPSSFGQSTAIEIWSDRAVRDAGRSILETIGFTGVAKVDLKRGPDGSLSLLEVNPRFNLWHHPGALAGVNIPAIVYSHLTSAPITQSPALDRVRWCKVWGDRPAAHSTGVGMREWLGFVASCEARRGVHLDDPGALVGVFTDGAKRVGRRAASRLPNARDLSRRGDEGTRSSRSSPTTASADEGTARIPDRSAPSAPR